MSRLTPVLDADLHAFVDQQGDAAQRIRVQAYLAGHIEAARRVAGWSAQNEALREAFPLPVSVKSVQAAREPNYASKTSHLSYGLTLALAFLAGIAVAVAFYTISESVSAKGKNSQSLIQSMFLRG